MAMATRPLPHVLQVEGYSSSSSEGPSTSSQSSCDSSLPKGARAPSPQIPKLPLPLDPFNTHSTPPSSWRLEWRSLSRVINWVAPKRTNTRLTSSPSRRRVFINDNPAQHTDEHHEHDVNDIDTTPPSASSSLADLHAHSEFSCRPTRATQSEMGHAQQPLATASFPALPFPASRRMPFKSTPFSDVGHSTSQSKTHRRSRSEVGHAYVPSPPLILSNYNNEPRSPRKLRKRSRPASLSEPFLPGSTMFASPSPPIPAYKYTHPYNAMTTSSEYTLSTATPPRSGPRKLSKRTPSLVNSSRRSSTLITVPFTEPLPTTITPPVPPIPEQYRPKRVSIITPPSSPRSPPLPQVLSDVPLSEPPEILHSKPLPVPPLQSSRPSFLRTESNRRWTVAVAEVPDELFMEELQRLRRMGMRAGEVHRSGEMDAVDGGGGDQEGSGTLVRSATQEEMVVPHGNGSGEENGEDDGEWVKALRALLCCRELVMTERSYLARLQQLLEGDTLQTVPPLLLRYLPALIDASKTLSARFNEDPSAWGVSAAFLGAEDTLETALVAWCGVVGEFFTAQPPMPISSIPSSPPPRVNTLESMPECDESVAHGASNTHDEFGARTSSNASLQHATTTNTTTKKTKRASTGSPTSPSSSSGMMAMSYAGLRTTTRNVGEAWRMRGSASLHLPLDVGLYFSPKSAAGGDTPTPTPNLSNTEKEEPREPWSVSAVNVARRRFSLRKTQVERKGTRKVPFRDLAIQPTQRLTRYVLLYKDLLAHTPRSSPAYDIVERAHASAMRLAQKCDRAQGNAAFLRRA